MVALLVVITILMFLVVDGVVLSMKARKGHAAALADRNLVFAQDGGEPIEEPDAKENAPMEEPNK